MTFKDVQNNEKLVEYLRQVSDSEELHHGYILEAPANVDKVMVAKSFIKAILCSVEPGEGCDCCSVCKKIDNDNHIDLTWVLATKVEGGNVSSVKDKNITDMLSRLQKKPLEAQRNIAVIQDADTLSLHAQNHLLKSLEEPPTGTVILLLSENPYKFPQTIRSRCIHLRISPWEKEALGKNHRKVAELVELLTIGAPYYQIKKIIDSLDKEKSEVLAMLDCMEEIYAQRLKTLPGAKVREDIYKAIAALEEARNETMNNLNTGYTIKRMALAIGGR